MRKLVTIGIMSLDGVMQAPGGPEEDPTGGFKYGGWSAPYFDNFLADVMTEQMSPPLNCRSAERLMRSLRHTGLM